MWHHIWLKDVGFYCGKIDESKSLLSVVFKDRNWNQIERSCSWNVRIYFRCRTPWYKIIVLQVSKSLQSPPQSPPPHTHTWEMGGKQKTKTHKNCHSSYEDIEHHHFKSAVQAWISSVEPQRQSDLQWSRPHSPPHQPAFPSLPSSSSLPPSFAHRQFKYLFCLLALLHGALVRKKIYAQVWSSGWEDVGLWWMADKRFYYVSSTK